MPGELTLRRWVTDDHRGDVNHPAARRVRRIGLVAVVLVVVVGDCGIAEGVGGGTTVGSVEGRNGAVAVVAGQAERIECR